MKITCNIIEDLLPLYIDQTLSEDSCHLVEEHVKECESCKRIQEELRKELPYLPNTDDRKAIEMEENTKAAFKGIRRKIWKKRAISACIAAICVLIAVKTADYIYYHWETYIPFEETGLEMRDGKLYATKTIDARLRSIVSPDQKKVFLFEIETVYARCEYPQRECEYLIKDYPSMLEAPEEGKEIRETETVMYGIERVYYLPKEYVNYSFDYNDPEIGAEQTRELESRSMLLWESERKD